MYFKILSMVSVCGHAGALVYIFLVDLWLIDDRVCSWSPKGSLWIVGRSDYVVSTFYAFLKVSVEVPFFLIPSNI